MLFDDSLRLLTLEKLLSPSSSLLSSEKSKASGSSDSSSLMRLRRFFLCGSFGRDTPLLNFLASGSHESSSSSSSLELLSPWLALEGLDSLRLFCDSRGGVDILRFGGGGFAAKSLSRFRFFLRATNCWSEYKGFLTEECFPFWRGEGSLERAEEGEVGFFFFVSFAVAAFLRTFLPAAAAFLFFSRRFGFFLVVAFVFARFRFRHHCVDQSSCHLPRPMLQQCHNLSLSGRVLF
mmetsp:Transcript_9975/g.14515  ORF Transcript_9975/g.14515 Transcript_9975/m.14515 type:complete len:235 (-) Transcript_9975:462-1166(-)